MHLTAQCLHWSLTSASGGREDSRCAWTCGLCSSPRFLSPPTPLVAVSNSAQQSAAGTKGYNKQIMQIAANQINSAIAHD